MLRLTAQHADIAAFTGARTVPGSTTGQREPLSAEDLDGRVARYREPARDRTEPAELNLLVQIRTPHRVPGPRAMPGGSPGTRPRNGGGVG